MATVSLLSNSRNLPDQLHISDRPAHQGGEGNVYFTADGLYAVKLYHRAAPAKQKLLEQVLNLGRNLGVDEQYLAWPLGIVDRRDGQPTVGVVTRRVPASHVPLYKLVYSPLTALEQFRQGRSWLDFLKMARAATAAVRTIHGKGMAHADLHLKNFLADPGSGEVVLIDLDGLVVPGFLPPQVKGMPGFIAPEVMMGNKSPDKSTDRHSLAVLVLWVLLFRNVMQTQQCYDPEDARHDDQLGYGQHACFSEHPHDRRNRIPGLGTPLFRNGALSYRTLPPKLQDLTERALIHGLHDPPQRPQVVEWERALAEAYDLLVSCPACRQSFFYPYGLRPPPRRQCPFCGTGVRPPLPGRAGVDGSPGQRRARAGPQGRALFGPALVRRPHRTGAMAPLHPTWGSHRGPNRLGCESRRAPFGQCRRRPLADPRGRERPGEPGGIGGLAPGRTLELRRGPAPGAGVGVARRGPSGQIRLLGRRRLANFPRAVARDSATIPHVRKRPGEAPTRGGMPEWSIGTDCKSVGLTPYEGSNPSPTTTCPPAQVRREGRIGKIGIDLEGVPP